MATSALSIYDRGNFHNRMPTTKRALLIGICYSTESSKLKGSHNDVKAFKELLLETYRYPEENITVMTDELSTPEHLWPTRENILRELRGFISQSQGNVQYCFLYAGHSIQSRCTDGTEEDGRNESLLPCDAMDILELDDQASLLAEEDVEGKVVMDDDLKRLLSDRLPSGCKLTAIMDTCHSATLLDQPHHRCNRIFRMSSSGRRVLRRTNEFIGRTLHQVPACGLAIAHAHQMMLAYAIPSEITFCDGLHCVRLRWYGTNRQPSVICIAASKDGENSWESPKGHSLTMALVKILKQDSRPRLKDLMRKLSSETEALLDRMFRELREWDRKTGKRSTVQKAYQNPQLSSDIPADMNHCFEL